MAQNKTQGQSMAEYAVLIGLVIAAAVAMSGPIRERIKSAINIQADAYHAAATNGTAYVNAVGYLTVRQDSEAESEMNFIDSGAGFTATNAWAGSELNF